jgi:Zn-dependent protease
MKRCGMKIKGFYVIPFLGAAAVTNDQFKSHRDEVYTALMGPIWGLVLALLSWGIYEMTGEVLFVGASIWMLFCTIFNLLPIMPLDGGRVMRCVLMSINSWGGLILFIISMAALAVFVKQIGIGLVLFFLVIGGVELIGEYFSITNKKKEIKVLEENIVSGIIIKSKYSPTEEIIIPLTPAQAKKAHLKIEELGVSIRTPMTRKGIVLSFFSLILIAGFCLSLMYELKHIPGSELALQILQDKAPDKTKKVNKKEIKSTLLLPSPEKPSERTK